VDQHRDRRRIPIGPRLRPRFSIPMDPPFHLDIGLVPEAQFGRHEMADKPAAVADLIGNGVAKIEDPPVLILGCSPSPGLDARKYYNAAAAAPVHTRR